MQCVDLAVYLGLSARHAVGVVLFQFGSSVEDFDILSWELEWLSGTRWNQTVLALGAVCVNGYHWEFFLSPLSLQTAGGQQHTHLSVQQPREQRCRMPTALQVPMRDYSILLKKIAFFQLLSSP